MPLRPLQAKQFSVATTKIRIGRRPRCRYDRCRRAIPHCGSDDAASIPKSGPEIKNRCTQQVVFGEILASIPKSGLEIKNRCSLWAVLKGFFTSIPKSEPEIKNRCTQEGVNGEKHASIPKFGLEIKNRCTKQPIFSTHPQQIPRHAFHRAPKHGFACGRARAGLTVAAKAGADAPGGGISLCFCRRGCAAPAQKAATLNGPYRSTRPKAATLNTPRCSTRPKAGTLNLEICAAPSGRRAAFFGAEGS